MGDNRIGSVVVVGGRQRRLDGRRGAGHLPGPAGARAPVESEQIGIVGVGEASVPHMRTFNAQVLGLDECEFAQRTQATAKLGIAFEDWGRIGERYVHGFGTIGQSRGPLPFHQFWLKQFLAGRAEPIGAYSLQTVMAPLERFVPGVANAPAGSPLADIAYAYHFDAGLYAQYLRQVSRRAVWSASRAASCRCTSIPRPAT